MRSADAYLAAWEAAGLGPALLPAGDGTLVVVRRGARAVPFDDRGRPLLWLAPAVRPDADVAAWAMTDAWNLGAERLWIGPELRLMVQDRSDFDGSYAMSPAMDPGDWRFDPDAGAGEGGTSEALSDGALTLRQELRLPVYQPGARLSLGVEQRVAVLADPARRWEESRRVRHLGWSREVSLTRLRDDDGSVACQAWVLAQVDAPATVLVPGAGTAAVTDYFEPIDDAHLHRGADALTLDVTGRRRYKVGVRTGEHRGVVACWRDLPGGEAALLVRSFLDAPSSRYLEEPPGSPGHEGDSVYVYNDDGRFGGFGEVEALGRALEPSQSSVTDLFEMHAWWGERDEVRALAARVTGSGAAPAG